MDFISPNFLYAVGKDICARLRARHRHLSDVERIELRDKWKPEFEAHIRDHRQQKLGVDAIIRDVRRVDHYPETDKTRRGISPWFRAGLMGTYHRGILIGLSWYKLTADGDDHDGNERWRYTDYKRGEQGDISVILIGYVPYENIASVDWQGDEYYSKPYIYCHFDAQKGEPYEKVVFCEEREMDGRPFYREVVRREDVRKRKRWSRLSRKR